MVRSGWLKVIICPASQLSIFAPGHICESMLHLERDDLVLRTAQIEAGDIFPCAVCYMDRPDVRGLLPGELFGVFSPFDTGEVVEERKERILAMHPIVLEVLYVSPCYLEGGAYGDGNLPSSHRMAPADGLSVQAGALHTGRRAS